MDIEYNEGEVLQMYDEFYAIVKDHFDNSKEGGDDST
jgi:hypothetical protein